ncbi:MAG: single-stranded DNA-binding protein [bacterium]
MMNLRLPEQNSVMLTGRLTRNAELRFTTKGNPVCSFDIAVNRRYLDMVSNEWKDDVSFIPIVVWGKAAERSNERGKKGTAVHVAGRLKSRSWETREGQKRTSIEVIANRVQFLSKVEEGDGGSAAAEPSNSGQEESEEAVQAEETETVPF